MDEPRQSNFNNIFHQPNPQPYNPAPPDHLLPATDESAPVPPPPPPVTPPTPPTPPAPVAPMAVPPPPADGGVAPVPVVRVLSPRGVEYVFLIISLFTGAIMLGALLIALINGQFGFSVLAYPVAALIVSLPVFAWLFLRLKKAELNNPALKLDASKRLSTQFTQIVAFLIAFFTLIGLVGVILASIGGDYKGALWKSILDVLVVELIAGGILFYYWRDEHQRIG